MSSAFRPTLYPFLPFPFHLRHLSPPFARPLCPLSSLCRFDDNPGEFDRNRSFSSVEWCSEGGTGGKVVLEGERNRRSKKRREEEEEWWGCCLLYCLVHFSGGGKATLKVRGDVVVAGTRRVFLPGRKRRYRCFLDSTKSSATCSER